jgi:hypothetical protein
MQGLSHLRYMNVTGHLKVRQFTLRRKSLHNPFGITRGVRSALSSLWVGRRPIGTQNPSMSAMACLHQLSRSGLKSVQRRDPRRP